MRSTIQQTRARQAAALRGTLPVGYSRKSAIAFLAESALSCPDVYGLFDLAGELITEVLDVDLVKVLHQPNLGALAVNTQKPTLPPCQKVGLRGGRRPPSATRKVPRASAEDLLRSPDRI